MRASVGGKYKSTRSIGTQPTSQRHWGGDEIKRKDQEGVEKVFATLPNFVVTSGHTQETKREEEEKKSFQSFHQWPLPSIGLRHTTWQMFLITVLGMSWSVVRIRNWVYRAGHDEYYTVYYACTPAWCRNQSFAAHLFYFLLSDPATLGTCKDSIKALSLSPSLF